MQTIRIQGATLGIGPSCDICTPDTHLLVRCSACGRERDEPPSPIENLVCKCGAVIQVTYEDIVRWEEEVLGVPKI